MTESVKNIPLPHVPETTAGRVKNTGKTTPGKGEDPAVSKVAMEFESLFIGMMLKSMRSTVGKDSLTGGGHGEEVYRSLLDQEYANAIASGSGLGLRKMIEEQLVSQTGDGKYNDNRTEP
ncbi:MAG: rod-binding protein [Geobacteraceae bacterium]|nr:rod-binding protein [Geobacteraceae bacterium]